MEALDLAPGEQLVQQWTTHGTIDRPVQRWTLTTRRVRGQRSAAGISEVETMPLDAIRSTGLQRVHHPWLLVVAALALFAVLVLVFVARVTNDPSAMSRQLYRFVRESVLRDLFNTAQTMLIGSVAAYFLTRHVRLVVSSSEHAFGLRVRGGVVTRDRALEFQNLLEAHAARLRAGTRRRRATQFAAWAGANGLPVASTATVGAAKRGIPVDVAVTLAGALAAWVLGFVASSAIGPSQGANRSVASSDAPRSEARDDRRNGIGFRRDESGNGFRLRRGNISGITVAANRPPSIAPQAAVQQPVAPQPVAQQPAVAVQAPPEPVQAADNDPGIVLHPDSVVASSEYHVGRETHPAAHAFDANTHTAWNDGVSGTGAGEWIEARFGSGTHVTSMRIDTGWNFVSPRFGDLFVANSHIRRLRLVFDEGAPIEREVAEDQRSIEVTGIDRVVRSVRVVAVDVWDGTRFHDMCISEIEIRGTPNNETQDSPE